METFLLIVQLALTAAGFALLWSRLVRLQGEVARLRETVEALQSRKAAPRAAIASATARPAALDARDVETPHARAARAWSLPPRKDRAGMGAWKPIGAVRSGTLALVAVAPALGFLVGASAGAVATTGLVFAAATVLAAARPGWRAAGWAACLCAAGWAVIGLALGGPDAATLMAAGIAVVGVSGLAYAALRDPVTGGALAVVAAMATLWMAVAHGVVGPGGAALGVITIGAALVGAASLRLEAFHLGAFALTLLALFVLSGQADAAIWFTPISAWAGALFLGIAAVRVPALGSRGVTLAGAGALAPLTAVLALHGARHALDSRYAAAGALMAVSIALIAILYLAAQRRLGGLMALGMTAWVLAIGAVGSCAAALLIALPAPFAASAFGGLALALMALNARFTHSVWRMLACAAGFFVALFAILTIEFFFGASRPAPGWIMILFGLATPAGLAFAAAHFAKRASASALHVTFDLLGLALLIGALHLATRLAFAGEATHLGAIGFAEAGTHISIWLGGALLAALPANAGPRTAASMLLAAPALGALVLTTALWLSPFWSDRAATFSAPATLGFFLPAALMGAHWAFWRARGAQVRTHTAFAAGTLATACGLALWLNQSEDLPDWIGALASAVAFAGAISLNLAPGITKGEGRRP